VTQAPELAAGFDVPDVNRRALIIGHRKAAPVGAPGEPADVAFVMQVERRAIAWAAPDEHRSAADGGGDSGPVRAPGNRLHVVGAGGELSSLLRLPSRHEEQLAQQPFVLQERLPLQGLGPEEGDQVTEIRRIALEEVGLRGKLAGKHLLLGLVGLFPLLLRLLLLLLGLFLLHFREVALLLGHLLLRLRRIALRLGLVPRMRGGVALLLGGIARVLGFCHRHLELAKRLLGTFALDLRSLESVRGLLEQGTSAPRRESVPDSFLSEAGRVVNLDLALEDLLERLRPGKAQTSDTVARVLESFFKPDNAETLRELALRELALSREQGVNEEQEPSAPRPTRAAGGRVMVCISSLSPRAAIAASSAPICAGVASPSMIAPIAAAASSSDSRSPRASFARWRLMLTFAPSPRKFRSRSFPAVVRTLSGWNWTPSSGRPRWRRPITTPPSVQAETSRQSGTLSGATTSEW